MTAKLHQIVSDESRATLGRSMAVRIKRILQALAREIDMTVSEVELWKHATERVVSVRYPDRRQRLGTSADVTRFVDQTIGNNPALRTGMANADIDANVIFKIFFSFDAVLSGRRIRFEDAIVSIKKTFASASAGSRSGMQYL